MGCVWFCSPRVLSCLDFLHVGLGSFHWDQEFLSCPPPARSLSLSLSLSLCLSLSLSTCLHLLHSFAILEYSRTAEFGSKLNQ